MYNTHVYFLKTNKQRVSGCLWNVGEKMNTVSGIVLISLGVGRGGGCGSGKKTKT